MVREKLAAMLDVLKSRWQTNGWHVMAPQDSEPMALEFIRELDRHEIPWRHYRELYQRSLDLRARRFEQGLKCDDFSVDLMIACWPGLTADLKQRDIDNGWMLASNAASVCRHCFGTGFKQVQDDRGYFGAVKCDHEEDV